MGKPAAKEGDLIINLEPPMDIHIVLVPTPTGEVPVPTPFPFRGELSLLLSENVFINARPAATVGSMALNEPPHIPVDGTFQFPPSNEGIVIQGSISVLINGKPAARQGDAAQTCHDLPPEPVPQEPTPLVQVVGAANVMIGG